MVNDLLKTSFSLMKSERLGGLEEKYTKIVEEIYEKKNSKCLMGEEAEEFYSRLKMLSKASYSGQVDEVVKKYREVL